MTDKKTMLFAFAFLGLLAAPSRVLSDDAPADASAGDAAALLPIKEVDDFNGGEDKNLLGGKTSAWTGDKTDSSIHITAEIDGQVHRGDSGSALKLDYNINSVRQHLSFPTQGQSQYMQQTPEVQGTGFGGYTTPLMDLDASSMKYLTLWVKGDPQKGFTKRFRVELYDGVRVSGVWVEGITANWQQFTFGLKQFNQIEGWDKLKSLTMVFDSQMSNKAGVLYVDDIYFSAAPGSK